jgi:hypothetical protein
MHVTRGMSANMGNGGRPDQRRGGICYNPRNIIMLQTRIQGMNIEAACEYGHICETISLDPVNMA